MKAHSLKVVEPIKTNKVTANKVLFIKLGKGGEWEKDCIQSNTLRLSFVEPEFKWCLNDEWERVKNHYIELGRNKSTASRYVTQIRYFFEEPEDTIWITFYQNQLWWTQAKTQISQKTDKTKIRACLSKWSNTDIKGQNTFNSDKISGKLLKTQAFRGTICEIKEKDYVLQKINGDKSKQVLSTKEAYEKLRENLSPLIKELTWQDFETLIDLIFTQAGWKRVSTVGKTAKTLDLDLQSPITNEKCLVQIKSESNNKELKEYLEKFKSMDNYDKFYYIFHTFKDSYPLKIDNKKVKLLLVDEISKLAIDSGLSQWIIDKVS